MIEFIVKGGIFMYPIILCSVVSLAIFLERMWSLRKGRVIPGKFLIQLEEFLLKDKIDDAILFCRRNDSPIARIIEAGLRSASRKRDSLKEVMEETGRRESFQLEKYIETMSTIASVSTLLGLLGTISGMIKIFSVISHQAAVNPPSLAGGISEALYTTAAGLAVAIPTIVGYRFLTSRVDILIKEMEEFSNHVLEILCKNRE